MGRDLFADDKDDKDKPKGGRNIFAPPKVEADADAVAGWAEPPPVDWWNWARTRGQHVVTGLAGAPRSASDLVDLGIQYPFRAAGYPETGANVSKMVRSKIPGLEIGAHLPTAETINQEVNKLHGRSDTDSPERWGIGGKVLDATTEGVIGGLLMGPGGGVASVAPNSVVRVAPSVARTVGGIAAAEARTILPNAAASAASEGAANFPGVKNTPFELPVRLLTGTAAGGGTGMLQNRFGALPPQLNAQLEAARRLGESIYNDARREGLSHEQALQRAIERHQEYLSGTPFAYTLGADARGTVRGAYTAKGGPARETMEAAQDRFVEGGDARVGPVIDRVSPFAATREADLRAQASRDASPAYRAAGVADDPVQTVLPTREGPVPPGQLGPGAPVTPIATNSTVLRSPDLINYLGRSAHIQAAIKQARALPEFLDEPVTSMAMLDKIYKNLGGVEGAAVRSGDGEAARDIGRVRRQLLEHIDRENPQYAAALRAFAEPSALADAFALGRQSAGANMSGEEFGRVFRGLATPEEQREFLGGVATWMRGKADRTDRGTPAERFWNNSQTRDKIQELFPTVTDLGPDNIYGVMNRQLENDKRAARNMRDIMKGSDTTKKLNDRAESDRTTAIDEAVELAKKGVTARASEKIMEGLAKLKSERARQRGEDINAEIANLSMATDPQELVRLQGLVATAQQQHAARQAAASSAYSGMRTGTGMSLLGPADRIMQGLLGGQ